MCVCVCMYVYLMEHFEDPYLKVTNSVVIDNAKHAPYKRGRISFGTHFNNCIWGNTPLKINLNVPIYNGMGGNSICSDGRCYSYATRNINTNWNCVTSICIRV